MPVYLPSKYKKQLPADIGNEETEAVLDEMIAEIESVYGQAYTELKKKADDFLAWFVAEDISKRNQWQNGDITKQEYQNWRMNRLLEGQHWYAMVETMAVDYTNANIIASSIINGYMPEVYAINGNWAAYEIEHGTNVNISFELFDTHTIERLIAEKPDLLPKSTVNIPLDEQWNKQLMNSAVTQSILQGESVDQLADRLAGITDMNQSAAVRNAKTMTTSAQNGGRLASYEYAESLGIKMQKRWLATLDGHTRPSHRALDGVAVDTDEPFDNGLMFPGDPSGEPAEIYNCRCRMIAAFPEQDFSKFERHSRLGDMSYDEWKDAHGDEPIFRQARNENRDMNMFREYQSLLGRKAPSRFSDFQDLKYNHPDQWKAMVAAAREARWNRRHGR